MRDRPGQMWQLTLFGTCESIHFIMNIPGNEAFTVKEWELICSLRTPAQVQHFLSTLPYNQEQEGDTLRSFRRVVRKREAHCLEAALVAAAILEQRGYPPLLLSLASQDMLDHVVYVFRM